MNILIVTNHFWPENFRINDLAVGLKEKGHAVTVLTGIPDYPEGRYYDGYGLFRKRVEDYHGITVKRVPRISRGSGRGFRLICNYLSFAIMSCLMAPFLCRERYDAILVFESSPVTVGLPAIVLKKLKGTPIFFWVQDLWPESLTATGVVNSPLILRMVGSMVRYIYRNCDRILIQSRRFRESISCRGVTDDVIQYFPNSIEEIFRPLPAENGSEEAALLPEGFRIMFAGNIGSAQAFGTLVEAARKLRDRTDIRWIVLGDGRMREWVERQIEAHSLHGTVLLLGRYPLDAMPRFFSLADVMLVSLKRDPIFSRTIPSKIQSYLACGKPVIASLDGEGGRVIEESGAGFACPAEDADALAAAVLKMYDLGTEQRQLMGESGRRYCDEHFNRDMLLDRLEGWMSGLIKEEKSESTDPRWRRHAGAPAVHKSPAAT